MQNSSMLLVIPLSAVLAGASAGLVQHFLSKPDPVAPTLPVPTESPSEALRNALAPTVDRLDRVIRQLEMQGAAEGTEVRRSPVPGEGTDLELLQEIIERIEAVQRGLTDQVTRSAVSPGSPALLGRHKPTDWANIEPLFLSDLEQANALAVERYQFATLGEILAEFGRPSHAYVNDGVFSLNYEQGDRTVRIRLRDGYVFNIWLDD